MQEGTASHTARSVAARRLEYDRAAAPYGDPAADDALTRDVAGGLTPRRGRMHEYIRARTAFFDRAVVNSLDRGVAQVVIGGAGYDGRPFRYAKPGVRWFEVDHPATQADKRERIGRLGLAASHVRFIPADFTADPVAGPLLAAGLDPGRPALFLFEGVAVYLERPVIERVLAEFREVTRPGSPLAISVSVGAATSETRAQFQERVAALGEPARTVLTAEQASDLLSAAGWALGEGSDRQRSAGLLLARAATAPRHPERPRLTPPPPVPPAAQPAPAGPLAGPGTGPATPASAGTAAGSVTRISQPGRSSTAPGAPAEAVTASPGSGDAAAGLPGTAAGTARPPGAPPAGLPLSALLSQALVAFTIEADNEAELRIPHRTQTFGRAPGAPPGAPWLTSMLMWANCLRHLPDEGITIAELRARARTGTNLDGMRRWRYVTFTPDPGHGKRPLRDALIRPTAWGSAARDTWQEVTAEVESRWRGRLGDAGFGALRAAAASLAGPLDPALPDCLPILGYGLYSHLAEDRASFPPSGESPVDLPLWALLSRPLLAFAVQYETEPGPSLAVSADILRVLTEDGVATKDIPALGGVSKESVAMAMGVLRKSGLAAEGPGPRGSRFKFTRLTARGVLARAGYPALTAGIERDWRTRFGDARVTALRAALERLAAGQPPALRAGLDPHPENWRARLPPPRTLPHYPMTLHRGGYPDGS